MFSKLPQSVCCGQTNSVQPIIVNLDGQTYHMQNIHNQGPTVQGSYVMQPVPAHAPITTVQTGVPMTTLHSPAYGQLSTVQTGMPVTTIQQPVPVATLQTTVPVTQAVTPANGQPTVPLTSVQPAHDGATVSTETN